MSLCLSSGKEKNIKKVNSRCKKKHYGKVQLEDDNCPSGSRNNKCHCILKNNKVSTKIYKMQKKKNIEFFKKGKCPSGGRKKKCH